MEAIPILRELVLKTSLTVEARLKDKVNEVLSALEGMGQKAHRNAVSIVAPQLAYGIVLRILLYRLLEQSYALPKLEGRSLRELISAFRNTYEITGLEAFKPITLDELLVGIDDDVGTLLNSALKTIESPRAEEDALRLFYEDLMPQEERRRLGEFYTPTHIARFMVRWSLRNKDDVVFDPGVGSGTFLIESLYRLLELGMPPEEAISRLYGVDINPLAVMMSTINLLIRVPKAIPNVILNDFFRLKPLSGKIPFFDVVVCNPPYTRHHELTQGYKEELARLIEEESGIRVSRLSSLYLHFFIHATKFLREGSRIAFITPSEWLEASYGGTLRDYLPNNLSLKAIILFPTEQLIFPGVLTTATITLAVKGEPSDHVKLIKVDRWPGMDELIKAVEAKPE